MSRKRERKLLRRMRGARGLSTALYIAGVAIVGSGLVAAGIVAAAVGSATGLGIAAGIGAASLAMGGFALWESRRAGTRAGRLQSDLREQQILRLATKSSTPLTVTEVATALSIPSAEAEAALDAMVDETRVSMKITDEGGIVYEFLELGPTPDGPRVRVGTDGGVDAEEVLADPEEIIKQARRNRSRR